RAMHRHLGAVAAACRLLAGLGGSGATLAQKQGGILRVYHWDSPPSSSIHEEVTYSTDVSMMGVFNNLVMYKQDEPKNSVQSIAPGLGSGWSWGEDGPPTDLPTARVLAMGDRHPRRSVLSQE